MKAIIILLLCFSAWSEKVSLNYKNYDEALKATNRIVFNMESTKAGMLTTSFKGVVKKGSVTYKKAENGYSDIELIIGIKDIDTDNDARNEKMYNKCFSEENHPFLKVKIVHVVIPGSSQVSGSILVRGKWHSVPVSIDLNKVGSMIVVKGSVKLSLKKLEIPDPSIWIASVRDMVEVEFDFSL